MSRQRWPVKEGRQDADSPVQVIGQVRRLPDNHPANWSKLRRHLDALAGPARSARSNQAHRSSLSHLYLQGVDLSQTAHKGGQRGRQIVRSAFIALQGRELCRQTSSDH
jgi:hypothetical protein